MGGTPLAGDTFAEAELKTRFAKDREEDKETRRPGDQEIRTSGYQGIRELYFK